MLTFTTKSGDVDIHPEAIVAIRESLKSEKPGATVITTVDGKHHIVMEEMQAVREMIKDYD